MSENSRDEEQKEKSLQEQAEKLPSEKKASILKQLGAFVSSIGHGASALVKKITGYKSPGEVMDGINAQLDSMRAAREPLAKRHGELYAEIVAKKKLYQSAPPARRKVLEMELKSAIAEYQSLERQIAAYLRNETVLVKVKGRMCELVAMNLKVVSEDDIDKLTDSIEDAADEVQDIDGAVADLDKAGVRREMADASFEDALAAFGDEIPDAEAPSSQIGDGAGRADPLSDF